MLVYAQIALNWSWWIAWRSSFSLERSLFGVAQYGSVPAPRYGSVFIPDADGCDEAGLEIVASDCWLFAYEEIHLNSR